MNMYDIVRRYELGALRLMVIGILLIVIAALGSFVVKPVYKKYRDSTVKQQQLMQRKIPVTDFAGEFDRLSGEIETLESSLRDGLDRSQLKRLESMVLAKVQEKAWTYNLKVVRASADGRMNILSYKGMAFLFDFEGSYHDLVAFLNHVNEDLGYLSLETFELFPKNQADFNVVILRIKLAYYQAGMG